MGHMLATSNPEAAARVNGEGRPLPGVGETVVYHPRMGEVRRGRTEVPAIVLFRDESNRLLELLVIYDAGDEVAVERVPERVGDDRGWSRVRTESLELHETIADLRRQVEALTALVVGDFEPPEASVLAMLDAQDERVAKIEAGMSAPAPAPRRQRKAKAVSGQEAAAAPAAEDAAPRRRLRRG